MTGSTRTKYFDGSFHCINSLDMNKGGAMISCLQETQEFASNQDNPIKYIVIVSHDIDTYQDIQISFDDDYIIYELTPKYSNGPIANKPMTSIEKLGVSRTLIPGGYLIFKFNYALQK